MDDALKFASYVAHRLVLTGKHQSVFEDQVGLARTTVSRHLNGHNLPHYSTRRGYAAALGEDIDSFERGWRSFETESRLTTESNSPTPRAASDEGQTNSKHYFEVRAASGIVPHLARLDIATRLSEMEVVSGPSVGGADQENWLIVLIAGEAMSPKFEDGQQVLFRMIDKSAIEVGRDYLIITGGQLGTLRRVSKIEDDELKLTALNDKFKAFRVRMDEVELVGEPRFIVSDVPVD